MGFKDMLQRLFGSSKERAADVASTAKGAAGEVVDAVAKAGQEATE